MSNTTLCPFNITSTPVCTPDVNTTWYEGSHYFVKWFIYHPDFDKYEIINLYFYYMENYQYYKTVNYLNISSIRGYYPVFIDNSFFPINCTEKDITWDYRLLLIGNNIDPNSVLNDTLGIGKWHPTKFYLVQKSSNSCSNNIYSNSTFSNSSGIQSESNLSSSKIMDTWKIVVITICCVLFILISMILLKLTFFKNSKELKNKKLKYIKQETIYIKPDQKDSKIIEIHKPNQIDKY